MNVSEVGWIFEDDPEQLKDMIATLQWRCDHLQNLVNDLEYELFKAHQASDQAESVLRDARGQRGEQSSQFLPFEEAREFARKLCQEQGINSESKWRQWSKSGNRPQTVPGSPQKLYKSEWVSWGDFLGTGAIAARAYVFLPFKEARDKVRSACDLHNCNDKDGFCRLRKSHPQLLEGVPSHPQATYKNEWKGWPDWVGGRGRSQRAWTPEEDALVLDESKSLSQIAASIGVLGPTVKYRRKKLLKQQKGN